MNRELVEQQDIIGISFSQNAPPGIPRFDSKDKHCHFIGRARWTDAFYISKDDISCPLARFYLGIENPGLRELANILVSWDDATDVEIGLNFLKSAVRLKEIKEYIIYFSYPHQDLEPDVIIKIGSPDEIQITIQKFSSLTGERINASLSGIGAACGECTAYPLITKRANVSVGCYGSRPGVNLKAEELLLSFPGDSRLAKILYKEIGDD